LFTKKHTHTLDYDEASFNQAKFVTMSCENVVVITELYSCSTLPSTSQN